jgi:hypothetical protein
LEFRNATQLDFADISSEAWREYDFGDGTIVRIEAPLKLHVDDDNGHRVFDAAGLSHYIPPRWVHLRWQAKDGQPNFVL